VDASVVIVGSGPAGSATAIALARQDPRLAKATLLLDRAVFPRTKPCGGGVTNRGMSALRQLGLDPFEPQLHPIPVEEIELVLPSGRSALYTPKHPAFLVYARAELDAYLVERAIECGVTHTAATEVYRAVATSRGYEVSTSSGSLLCETVVFADGSTGNSRRAARSGSRAPDLARLADLTRPASLHERTMSTRAVLDWSCRDVGVRGYSWSFPAAGGAARNLGVFDRDPRANRPTRHQLLRTLTSVARSADDGETTAGVRAESFPLAMYDRGIAAGHRRMLFVGDALGSDPLLGEGISFALWHGIAAGRTIASCAGDADIVDQYQALARPHARELHRRARIASMLDTLRSPRALDLALQLGTRKWQRSMSGSAVRGTA